MQYLTLHEREIIRKKLDENYSCRKISTFLGRGMNTVGYEIRKNGGKAQYDPKKAQEKFIENVKIGNLRAAQKNKSLTRKREGWANRLQNLEFQMEIILDTIKELKNGKD